MNIFRKIWNLWPSRRKALEGDMREELESLAAIAEEDGARRELGNLTLAAEAAREVSIATWLEQLWGDIRFASRSLRKRPAFTVTAILSLALGIGSNIAVFGLINAVLLRPLAVKDPQSLAVLVSHSKNERIGDFGYPDYLQLRDRAEGLVSLLAASNAKPAQAGVGSESLEVQSKIVSSNYFQSLGVQPAAGRLFLDNDDARPIAVIRERLWQRGFGRALAAIGSQIELDNQLVTIVGVAPAKFLGEAVGEAPDVWATINLMPASRRNGLGFTWLNLMARLKPGVSLRAASARLNRAGLSLPNSFIDRISLEPGNLGGGGLRNGFRSPLLVLMGVVGLVLLIACTNLAALLLARTTARQREIAARLAIGASRGRVIRQLLTESVLLAGAGGAAGMLFAFWSQRLLLGIFSGAGRAVTLDLRPDARLLFFAAAVSLAAGALFGLAPAIHGVRANLGETLKMTSHNLAGRGRKWGLRSGLITLQVAFSFVLLVVGLLFVRTLLNLRNQDFGFQPSNVLSVRIEMPLQTQGLDWASLSRLMLERVPSIAGVRSATLSLSGTLSSSSSGVSGFRFDGQAPGGDVQRARANWVAPHYFQTAGIPLMAGREFSPFDTARTAKVAIINHTTARKYFGQESAVGKRFEFNQEWYEIVGVAKDARYQDPRESTPPFIYFAGLQHNSAMRSLEIRTSRPPRAIANEVREAVREVDQRWRVRGITTLEEQVDQKLARELLLTDVAGFFGALTVLLIAIGIHGTLAYSIERRTSEIGIRIALGAGRRAVLILVLRDVLVILGIGAGLGVGLSIMAGRVVRSMLFGLNHNDVATLALAVLVLVSAAGVAAYLPLRRALRIEPTTALRFE